MTTPAKLPPLHIRIGALETEPWTVLKPCPTTMSTAASLLDPSTLGDEGKRKQFTDENLRQFHCCFPSASSNDSKSAAYLHWSGINGEIFCHFSQLLHFTYDMIVPREDKKFGSLNATSGEWTGLLGMLQRGELETVIPIPVNEERSQHFLQSSHLWSAVYDAVVSNLTIASDSSPVLALFNLEAFAAIKHLTDPFKWKIWLSISGAVLLVAFICFALHKYYELRNNRLRTVTPTSTASRQENHIVVRRKMSKVVVDSSNNKSNSFFDPKPPPPLSVPGRPLPMQSGARLNWSIAAETVAELAVSVETILTFLTNQDTAQYGDRARELHSPLRMVVTSWALVCTILASLYSAQLVSITSLRVTRAAFETFTDMETLHIGLLTPEGTAGAKQLEQLAQNLVHTDPANGRALSRLLALSKPAWKSSMSESVRLLRGGGAAAHNTSTVGAVAAGNSAQQRYVLFGNLLDVSLEQARSCDLQRTSVRYMTTYVMSAMYFHKNDEPSAALARRFHHAIWTLRDTGLIETIKSNYHKNMQKIKHNGSTVTSTQDCGNLNPGDGGGGSGGTANGKPSAAEAEASQKGFQLVKISGCVSFLMIGLAAGIVFLLIENFIRRTSSSSSSSSSASTARVEKMK